MSIEKEFRKLNKKLLELKPKHNEAVEEIANLAKKADQKIDKLESDAKELVDSLEHQYDEFTKLRKAGNIVVPAVAILAFSLGILVGKFII
jgi:seryl-tRNA synthetase